MEETRLVSLTFPEDKLSLMMDRLQSLLSFHMLSASQYAKKGLSDQQDGRVRELVKRVEALIQALHLTPDPDATVMPLTDLDEIENRIRELEGQYALLEQAQQEVFQVVKENEDALNTLHFVNDADYTFDELKECRYVAVTFGRLPQDSVRKLSLFDHSHFAFLIFSEDRQYAWCCYITTKSNQAQVDNLFSALYFEKIEIPYFVHLSPVKSLEMIEEEQSKDKEHLKHIDRKIIELGSSCQQELLLMANQLEKNLALTKFKKYVADSSTGYQIIGYVTKDHLDEVKQCVKEIEGLRIEDYPSQVSAKRLNDAKLA